MRVNSYDPQYAQPPRADNPYAPPTHEPWTDDYVEAGLPVSEGNYWAGFAVGFFFALLGLIIVQIVAKSETKRGSLHGFLSRLGVALVFVLLSLLIHF